MRFGFIVWGLGISGGAAWMRIGHPGFDPAWLRAAAASEPFHVLAHTVLYGACALLALWRLPPLKAGLAALALAAVQELVQVVGARRFGAPEWFDLGVDALAIGLVVLGALVHRGRAGPG